MTTTKEDHPHADGDRALDRVHRNSWSANLETEAHAADRDRIVDDALTAVRNTAAGYHVNLVTHGEHGHPREYLFPVLADRFDETQIDWEYVDQCGCGGHVTRIHLPMEDG